MSGLPNETSLDPHVPPNRYVAIRRPQIEHIMWARRTGLITIMVMTLSFCLAVGKFVRRIASFVVQSVGMYCVRVMQRCVVSVSLSIAANTAIVRNIAMKVNVKIGGS